ncbi:MAG: hypothetical protein HYU80_02615 [Candidatus Blackburnbacteria bacterium]|nr:hypothetical protein [Candidatus Blackburnbacteria bacterium]
MFSRRLRVEEKRKTRKAYLLITLSGLLLVGFVFFGTNSLAQLTSLMGNSNGNSKSQSQEDKTPPARPNMDTLPHNTQTDKLIVTGKAEVGSRLKLYKNEEVVREATILDDSKFSLEIKLSKGKNIIWVTATDASGNESEKIPQTVFFDLEPPKLEISSPSDGESFGGTDEETLTINGTTEPEAKVTVNDRIAAVDGTGNFTVKYTLSEGQNELLFVAIDPAENKTEKTIKVLYTP